MAEFMTADRKTAFLLPPSMEEWLNEDHLARFIVEVVDQLDLSNLTRQYADPAQQHTTQPLFWASVVQQSNKCNFLAAWSISEVSACEAHQISVFSKADADQSGDRCRAKHRVGLGAAQLTGQ